MSISIWILVAFFLGFFLGIVGTTIQLRKIIDQQKQLLFKNGYEEGVKNCVFTKYGTNIIIDNVKNLNPKQLENMEPILNEFTGLLTSDILLEHKLIEIGYYENNRWHFSCDDEETKHVTYWFPIPSWY